MSVIASILRKIKRSLNSRILSSLLFLLQLFGKNNLFHQSKIDFCADGLITSHYYAGKYDVHFQNALAQAKKEFAGKHSLYHEYRIYIACNLMRNILCNRSQPIFIECGVGGGMTLFVYSKWIENLKDANMQDLFKNATYIGIDTFSGVDPTLISSESLIQYKFKQTAYLDSDYKKVKQRFSQYKNYIFKQGSIPYIFETEDFPTPDFLHIDMNNEKPEVEALKYFIPNMKPGSIILLDDYAFSSPKYTLQRKSIDRFLSENTSRTVLTLPSGQGLLVI